MTYDATIIEQLADNLYKQAATVELLCQVAIERNTRVAAEALTKGGAQAAS